MLQLLQLSPVAIYLRCVRQCSANKLEPIYVTVLVSVEFPRLMGNTGGIGNQ